MDSPYVAKVLDVNDENEILFMTMEYVDGISLSDLINQCGRINYDKAAYYIYRAAAGLASLRLAHGLGPDRVDRIHHHRPGSPQARPDPGRSEQHADDKGWLRVSKPFFSFQTCYFRESI